jgi:hypothetical protein
MKHQRRDEASAALKQDLEGRLPLIPFPNAHARTHRRLAGGTLSAEPSTLRTPTPDVLAAQQRRGAGDQDGRGSGGVGSEEAANDLAAMFDSLITKTSGSKVRGNRAPAAHEPPHLEQRPLQLTALAVRTLSFAMCPQQKPHRPQASPVAAASAAPSPASAPAAARKTPPSVGCGGSRIPQPQF